VLAAASLITPIAALAEEAADRHAGGAGGYNTRRWQASPTILALRAGAPFTGADPVYSNAPDALLSLTGLETSMSPAKTVNNANLVPRDVATLRGNWPARFPAYLVWLDPQQRDYLFTVDELRTVVTLTPVATFKDGAIYRIGPASP
jgi:hypothetical protein